MMRYVQFGNLVQRFELGVRLRTQEIAWDYGISQRTAQRWVAAIGSDLLRLEHKDGHWGKAL